MHDGIAVKSPALVDFAVLAAAAKAVFQPLAFSLFDTWFVLAAVSRVSCPKTTIPGPKAARARSSMIRILLKTPPLKVRNFAALCFACLASAGVRLHFLWGVGSSDGKSSGA